jgi:hypothetical protein
MRILKPGHLSDVVSARSAYRQMSEIVSSVRAFSDKRLEAGFRPLACRRVFDSQ